MYSEKQEKHVGMAVTVAVQFYIIFLGRPRNIDCTAAQMML